MPKLINLDDKLEPMVDESKPENIEQMQTYRQCFKLAVGYGQSKTANESRQAWQLLKKFRTAGDVELSEAEFGLLVQRVSFNQCQFMSAVHGQLLERLDNAK